MRQPRVIVSVVALISCALLSFAVADEPRDLREPLSKPEALAKETQAKRLLEVGRVDEAVAACQAGYVIEPSPRWFFNIAVILNNSARHEDALTWVSRLEAKNWNLNPRSLEAIARLRKETQAKLLLPEQTKQQNSGTQTTRTEEAPKPHLVVGSQRADASQPSWYADPTAWTLAGSGVGAIAVGAGLLLNASELRADADNVSDQRSMSELLDRADQRRAIGAVVLGIGVVALTSGVVKLALVPRVDGNLVIVPTTNRGVVGHFSATW